MRYIKEKKSLKILSCPSKKLPIHSPNMSMSKESMSLYDSNLQTDAHIALGAMMWPT